MEYTSRFFLVSITVDVVLLTICDGALHVLMIERGSKPDVDALALPGRLVRQDEDLPDAARREQRKQIGHDGEPAHLEQLATSGAPDRDSCARTVSVAYLAVLPSPLAPNAGTDVVDARLARSTPYSNSRCPSTTT